MCSRAPFLTFRKDGITTTLQPDCNCWHCDECRPELRRKWIENATERFQDSGLYFGWLLIPADMWPALHRKLKRCGAKYFRVRFATGMLGVIVGAPKHPYDWTFSAQPITETEALRKFTGWVSSIADGRGGNPVSSCREWSLPADKRSGWDVVAIGPSPARVRALAEQLDLECRDRRIAGVDMTVCRGDMLTVDRLCERLAANHSVGPKCPCYDELDSEPSDAGYWRGFPDEAPEPYLVGAVT